LGIGDWAQTPIPNPHLNVIENLLLFNLFLINFNN
jgi:hypothetical protein